ncbi:MAG: O-antigen ligase domain-containing protein [Phormidesmis sp. CAN_BIN36]|nr:O-antigen ligase domain-containing protein [Phormidesmis sp. CAN_BIN36]
MTSSRLFYPAPAWIAILSLVLFSALCLVVQVGGVLRYAFPAGSLAIAAFLYWRYPLLYVGFTWWIWFLAAFVRRLVDVQAGWADPNPVLLAPFFVTIVSLITFAKELPKAIKGAGLPFALCMMGVIYGFLVGLINSPPQTVVVPLLNWLAPVAFGYHLYSNWRIYPDLRQLLQRVFMWGVLVMGAYGVVQFLIAPGWDRFWLQNQATLVFGTPNPLGIRVFSTMHSPQPFACVMVAGLFLLLASQSSLRFPASGLGYLSLLLSLARSAWLSWIVALVVFLPSLKPKLQIQLILTLLVMMIVVLPLTTIDPFASVISARVQTIFSGQNDVSYAERSQGYSTVLTDAVTNIPGLGMGFVLKDASIGSNDSGILTLLLTLGWLGLLPYLGGLLLLIASLIQSHEAISDPFMSAARAIAIATFSQIGLNNVMLSSFGMVLWSFIGIAIAARQYYAKFSIGKQILESTR